MRARPWNDPPSTVAGAQSGRVRSHSCFVKWHVAERQPRRRTRRCASDPDDRHIASLPDHPASDASDGSADTCWSAGSGAEQWIQIDLGKPTSVKMVRLVISQYPEGQTDHQLWAGASPDRLTMIHEFKGYTKDPDVLEYSPPSPLIDIRFIKLVTIQSPSWVAWREIEVLGN